MLIRGNVFEHVGRVELWQRERAPRGEERGPDLLINVALHNGEQVAAALRRVIVFDEAEHFPEQLGALAAGIDNAIAVATEVANVFSHFLRPEPRFSPLSVRLIHGREQVRRGANRLRHLNRES